MRYEAVILAGGFGTRLQSVVSDVPKPMADIHGSPFLELLLRRLAQQGVCRVVLSVGYRHEVIQQYFGDSFASMEILYAIEQEPLGTGGGIQKALGMLQGADVFVLNGDTFFDVCLADLYRFHEQHQAAVTLSLKLMSPANRYGTVQLEGRRVTGFREKAVLPQGLINGGVYCMRRDVFVKEQMPQKFGFEKDFLEPKASVIPLFGRVEEAYFIDIGVPEDYRRAQLEWTRMVKD